MSGTRAVCGCNTQSEELNSAALTVCLSSKSRSPPTNYPQPGQYSLHRTGAVEEESKESDSTHHYDNTDHERLRVSFEGEYVLLCTKICQNKGDRGYDLTDLGLISSFPDAHIGGN